VGLNNCSHKTEHSRDNKGKGINKNRRRRGCNHHRWKSKWKM